VLSDAAGRRTRKSAHFVNSPYEPLPKPDMPRTGDRPRLRSPAYQRPAAFSRCIATIKDSKTDRVNWGWENGASAIEPSLTIALTADDPVFIANILGRHLASEYRQSSRARSEVPLRTQSHRLRFGHLIGYTVRIGWAGRTLTESRIAPTPRRGKPYRRRPHTPLDIRHAYLTSLRTSLT